MGRRRVLGSLPAVALRTKRARNLSPGSVVSTGEPATPLAAISPPLNLPTLAGKVLVVPKDVKGIPRRALLAAG